MITHDQHVIKLQKINSISLYTEVFINDHS